jgi:hypothetical protein
MRCAECGSTIPEDAVFCPVCAEPIAGDESESAPARRGPSRLWRMLGLVAGVLLVAGAGVLGVLAYSGMLPLHGGAAGSASGPAAIVEVVARTDLTRLKEGRIPQVWNTASVGFRSGTSADLFNAQLRATPALTRWTAISGQRVTFSGLPDKDGSFADVELNLADQSGDVPVHLQYVREAGAWRLSALETSRTAPKTP